MLLEIHCMYCRVVFLAVEAVVSPAPLEPEKPQTGLLALARWAHSLCCG